MTDINCSDLEFEKLLDRYNYNFQKGDLVKGIVCAYDSSGASVDIGAKTAAYIPLREAAADRTAKIEDVLKLNETYEFLIISEEDEDGKFLLSYRKTALAYAWKELEQIKEENAEIESSVISSVKGGLLVEIKGIRGFIPSSRLIPAQYKPGDTLKVKVIAADMQQNSLILSCRSVSEDEKSSDRKELLEKIEIGDIIEGEAVRVTDFGVFVNIGGLDALLPLSQISWRWIEHPSDIIQTGDKIKAEVISIDKGKQRISLSLKNLEKNPWEEAESKIQEGAEIDGVITRIKNFGMFIEVFPGVEALLPDDEAAEYQNKNGVILKPGSKVRAVVLKFNAPARRISLSLKND